MECPPPYRGTPRLGVDIFGHFWTLLDILWTFLVFFGHFWSFLDIFGHLAFLDIFGLFWTFLDIFGLFWHFSTTFGHFSTSYDIFWPSKNVKDVEKCQHQVWGWTSIVKCTEVAPLGNSKRQEQTISSFIEVEEDQKMVVLSKRIS